MKAKKFNIGGLDREYTPSINENDRPIDKQIFQRLQSLQNQKSSHYKAHETFQLERCESIINTTINIATEHIKEDEEILDREEKIRMFDNVFERSYIIKEGEYIYNNCIRIVKFISEGAQARIYHGLIEEIDRYVAVKRYILKYDESEVCKIKAEFDNVKNLDHVNIVKYYDIEITTSDEIYGLGKTCQIDIIMEYLEGLNLKDFLAAYTNFHQTRGLPINMVVQFIRKILCGLKYLHENRIIHRDLKPANVIISDDFSDIKILDFGISTCVKQCETFKKRTLLGTPFYMSPEVMLGKPYSYDADIWSLGCIVYELVCGVKPFSDLNLLNGVMAQYSSPLEYADDDIKDIFYDKQNKNVYDFLMQCWKPNNIFRPTAEQMLEHKFLKIT